MPESKAHLTPKQLADAIGVSESSLRRWVDRGGLRIGRTSGGHRRIPIPEAIRFIRETGSAVVRPELLGLDGDLEPLHPPDSILSEAQRLHDAFLAGDRRTSRGLLVSWYLAGRNLPTIFDGPFRDAMHRIGELWKQNPRGILEEHRATETCLDALKELHGLVPAPRSDAPLALGGTPETEAHFIASTMAAMTLEEAGFRTINYGEHTPLHLLGTAAVEHGAKLVWISATMPVDKRTARQTVQELALQLAANQTQLIIGGQHGPDLIPPGSTNIHAGASMAELAGFARGLTASSNIATTTDSAQTA